MVDRRLQHLAFGREPEAVVDELGIFRHQLVLEVRRAAIERDAFDTAMRPRIDFAAGRFIHPARLHADEAVLDEVETRSEEHTSELQSLMRISYAVFCLKQKNTTK